ncbi:MAG TPA: ABC transporter permease, partial [Acidimicrobiia bacterium]
ATFGFVDADGGDAAGALADVLDQLARTDQFTIVDFDSVAAVEAAIESDEISAAFVVPEGFSDMVGVQETTIAVVGNVDAPTGSAVAAAIAEAYAVNVERVSVSVGAAIAAGAGPDTVPALVQQAASQPPLAHLGDLTTVVRQMDGPTYAMAGMAVFFLFFTVQFGVAGLLEERRLGTWDRLIGAGVSKGTITAAKALVSFLLGVVSMAVLMIGAAIGLGASWGDPLAVAALVVMGVLAATAVMALVAAFANTVEGAGNVQSIIAVLLGVLGGTFVPVAGEGILSKLSLLTPHAWFMRGLNDLSGGGSIGLVLPSLLAIGAFAVVVGAAAVWALGRKALV